MKNSRRIMHPATLYLLLAVGVVLFSWIGDIYELQTVLPATGEVIYIRSVLSAEGIRWLLRHVVANFTGFAPLGMAMMAFLGLGVAEHSGFLNACVRRCLPHAKRRHWLVVFVVVLGILSNVLGDAGYILLIPLAAFLYRAVGFPPLAGIVTAYVSVACGYSANLFLSTMDPLLARITQEAMAGAGVTAYPVGALSNMLFMMVSAVVIAAVVCWLGRRSLLDIQASSTELLAPLSRKEWRALTLSWLVGSGCLLLVVLVAFSPWGILRGITGGLTRSPFIAGALFLLSLGLGLMGTVYGFASGRYRKDGDVVQGLSSQFPTMGVFFVIAFFASQLLACFSYSRLDRWLMVEGGYVLASLPIPAGWLLPVFVVGVALLNLLMVSSTGKWLLLSSIFVPLFAILGVSADWVQCAYRIGDSVTNAVTPFMFYLPFVLACVLRYCPGCGCADFFRQTWHHTAWVALAWMFLFGCWYVLQWPLGW